MYPLLPTTIAFIEPSKYTSLNILPDIDGIFAGFQLVPPFLVYEIILPPTATPLFVSANRTDRYTLPTESVLVVGGVINDILPAPMSNLCSLFPPTTIKFWQYPAHLPFYGFLL